MLTVITGPMFAGKTETLIRVIGEHEDVGVFRPSMDRRYKSDCLVSHGGKTHTATHIDLPITDWDRLLQHRTIVIDEVQFLSDEDAAFIVEHSKSRHMFVAGLNFTYKREPFGCMPYLLARADSVVNLLSSCYICKSPAQYTYRTTTSTETILVGGDELYQPVCGDCFGRE
jgi:thymidine kinase